MDGQIQNTLYLLGFLFCGRILVAAVDQFWPGDNGVRHKLVIVSLKNLLFAIGLVSALAIWHSALQDMALSLAAFAVAIVIATKEIILCFFGSFYKLFSSSFKVGDRIELDGIRGDVVDISMVDTTVMEIGPKDYTHQYTGRNITFPNSYFFAHRVINETGHGKYVLHTFAVYIENNDKEVRRSAELLMSASQEVCNQYLADAEKVFKKLREIDKIALKPQVNISYASHESVRLVVRVPAPARKKGMIEQSIINKYLDYKERT